MITKFVHRAVFFFPRILCYYLLRFTDEYHIKTLNMKCPGMQRRNLKLKNNSNVKFKSMKIKICRVNTNLTQQCTALLQQSLLKMTYNIIKCQIKLFLSFQISNSICDIFKFDCLVFINTKYDKETKQI